MKCFNKATEEEAQQEEATFETVAATDRRQLIQEKLTLQLDDDVLFISYGPGFEPAELVEVVG